MPPGVRLSLTAPLHAEGNLEISTASRGMAGLIAKAIQLPPSGEAVPSALDLAEVPGGIEWTRRFGTMRAVSRQWMRGDRFVEAAPPFEIELDMIAEGPTVVMRQTGLRLFGLPMPSLMGPRVSGVLSAGPDERSWDVTVTIGHVWFGTITSYRGVMRAE